MKTHVLRGSKQEIADRLVQLSGEVHEAIVFEDDPAAITTRLDEAAADIFAEMQEMMVDAAALDDSREAIYARKDAE